MHSIDYLGTYCVILPLLFFVIAVSFRLMDNSALLFLQKDIMVSSSYVSRNTIKRHIASNPDKVFTGKLRRALLYRGLHRIFIILMITSTITAISCFMLA